MRKVFLIAIIVIMGTDSFCQQAKKERKEQSRKRINALVKQEEEGVIAYRKSTVFGAKLINDGYGAFMEIGRAKSIKKATLFQLEIAERKSPREIKESNPANYSSPYIYGKENFVYPIKLGVQQQILFGNKSNKNGVSVTGNFGGGLAISLLRPYYIQVYSTGKYIKYQSPDSAAFLDNSPLAINAGPGLSKGWNDITIDPGAYVKSALRFDYGTYNELVSAVEVGITGEFYSKKVPIMVREPQKQFFFSGFVAIMFGKRK